MDVCTFGFLYCCTLTACPHQMCPLVLALLKVCHHTVHDMGLWGEDVKGFDIAVRGPSVEDLFDVWSGLIAVET